MNHLKNKFKTGDLIFDRVCKTYNVFVLGCDEEGYYYYLLFSDLSFGKQHVCYIDKYYFS
jgi:hypothetical protein